MKLTFDEVLEMLNEERQISPGSVPERVKDRKVWVNANGTPGCLYDYQSINLTKKDAIESCKLIAGEYPRGFVTNLRKHERTEIDGYIYRVYQISIRELL